MTEKIKVLIVDKMKLSRMGLTMLLGETGIIEVVGEADNGITAIEQTKLLKPNVMLMDIAMSEMDGIEATKQIKALYPEIKIIMLTSHTDQECFKASIEAGADGYAICNIKTESLINVIKHVYNGGELCIDPYFSKGFMDGKRPFFAISKIKLYVMSICTFGLYQIFWFYKNWELIQSKENSCLSPLIRSIFGPFYLYSLLKRMQSYWINSNSEKNFKPGLLTFFYIIALILADISTSFIPNGISILFYCLPLLLIQAKINQLYFNSGYKLEINSRFSKGNIIGILLGGFLLILIILNAILPSSAP